jgi:uncharacterized protein
MPEHDDEPIATWDLWVRRSMNAPPAIDRPTPSTPNRALKLMGIGTLAGLFSGIFGVGGGTVIVPLLVLWMGYGEREATGTSLAAIVFIAAFAAAVQAGYGNVRVRDGLLVGVPAVGGVLLGAWLQQRLQSRTIALLFAAVLVASAVELLVR